MPTRTITITDEAYERLKAKKEALESFTDVILRITEKGDIMEFAGSWKKTSGRPENGLP
mgnify:CR=1 FL=1